MVSGVRRTAGTVNQARLTELAAELSAILDQKRSLEAREKAIKGEITAITSEYGLPDKDGKSEYLDVHAINKALQVVRPEPTTTVGDPELLRDRLGCDLFHKVTKIKTVEFLGDAWILLRAEERVKDEDLEGVVTVRENAPRIGFQKMRNKG